MMWCWVALSCDSNVMFSFFSSSSSFWRISFWRAAECLASETPALSFANFWNICILSRVWACTDVCCIFSCWISGGKVILKSFALVFYSSTGAFWLFSPLCSSSHSPISPKSKLKAYSLRTNSISSSFSALDCWNSFRIFKAGGMSALPFLYFRMNFCSATLNFYLIWLLTLSENFLSYLNLKKSKSVSSSWNFYLTKSSLSAN